MTISTLKIARACIGFGALLGQAAQADQIAVCITATGRYLHFAHELIESMRPRFMVGHEVTYYVFTDQESEPQQDVKIVPWPRFGWPADTMKRTSAYLSQQEALSTYDWVYALDADMLVIAPVGEELFGDTVGVSYWKPGTGTWETNPASTAYLPPELRKAYYAGGVYGGSSKGFLRICQFCKQNQERDEQHGITAIWHDESHLNCFFGRYPPAITLGKPYCWGEEPNADLSQAKIVARSKNHAWYRSP